MKLAVREVVQLSQRCFLAAGFDEGSALTNAKRVWWAEAYNGAGLTTLHDLLGVLPAVDPDEQSYRRHGSMVSVIDGNGQPSIATSTPTLDLACAHADTHGIGFAYASADPDDPSLPALGHLAYHAAERGYHALVVHEGGSSPSRTAVAAPAQPRPLIGEYELSGPSVTFRRIRELIETGIDGRHHNPLSQVFFLDDDVDERYESADSRLLDRMLQQALEPVETGGEETGYVVVCHDPSHPFHSREIWQVTERFIRDGDPRLDVFDPERSRSRIGTLVREGVEVEESVWRDIFEFGKGVLAPPFEGSEKGAGFGLNELTSADD
jgi:hypothetical protein